LLLSSVSIASSFDYITIGGSDKLALQVVDVTFLVKQVLVVLSFDLNSLQTLKGQVFRVVDIDNVLAFFFAGLLTFLLTLLFVVHDLELGIAFALHVLMRDQVSIFVDHNSVFKSTDFDSVLFLEPVLILDMLFEVSITLDLLLEVSVVFVVILKSIRLPISKDVLLL